MSHLWRGVPHMPFAEGNGIAEGCLGCDDLVLGPWRHAAGVLQGAGPAQAGMVGCCSVQEGSYASTLAACLPASHKHTLSSSSS